MVKTVLINISDQSKQINLLKSEISNDLIGLLFRGKHWDNDLTGLLSRGKH